MSKIKAESEFYDIVGIGSMFKVIEETEDQVVLEEPFSENPRRMAIKKLSKNEVNKIYNEIFEDTE